jgi:hypothetical protein
LSLAAALHRLHLYRASDSVSDAWKACIKTIRGRRPREPETEQLAVDRLRDFHRACAADLRDCPNFGWLGRVGGVRPRERSG